MSRWRQGGEIWPRNTQKAGEAFTVYIRVFCGQIQRRSLEAGSPGAVIPLLSIGFGDLCAPRVPPVAASTRRATPEIQWI